MKVLLDAGSEWVFADSSLAFVALRNLFDGVQLVELRRFNKRAVGNSESRDTWSYSIPSFVKSTWI